MASSEIEHKRAQTFIFEALHLNAQLPTAVTAQLMQAEDWDYLLRIAKDHRLGAMLHNRLKRDDLAHIVPERVLTSLKAAYRKSALRSLVVYRELAKVTQLLEAEGIPSIALKGAYLARFAYPDPALRPMRDIDLLLKPEQAIKAFELLKSQGYRVYDAVPETVFTNLIHLPPLISSEGIAIELHRRLFEPEFGLEPSTDSESTLWESCLFENVGGIQVRFLSTETLLLHLCIHATISHHFNLGTLALADVAFLVKTHVIDWHKFLEMVSTGGWQRCALALLYLAKKNLGVDIPDELIAALGGQECDVAWLESGECLLFSELADHRLMSDNFKTVVGYMPLSKKFDALFRAIFPPRHIIARDSLINKHSKKAFGYYPLRWYRLLTKTLPLALTVFFSQKKHHIRPLARHRTAFDNWLHEKPPH